MSTNENTVTAPLISRCGSGTVNSILLVDIEILMFNIFSPDLSTEWKIFKISVHFKLLYQIARRKTRVTIRVIEHEKGRPVEMLFIITITFYKDQQYS